MVLAREIPVWEGGEHCWLRTKGKEREMFGGEAHTTNNRMELMGAIAALEVLSRPCHIRLHTDSKYVQQGISEWVHGWKQRGWKTASKQPVKTKDLWRRLDEAVARHKIEWIWIKGHADTRRMNVPTNWQIVASKIF